MQTRPLCLLRRTRNKNRIWTKKMNCIKKCCVILAAALLAFSSCAAADALFSLESSVSGNGLEDNLQANLLEQEGKVLLISPDIGDVCAVLGEESGAFDSLWDSLKGIPDLPDIIHNIRSRWTAFLAENENQFSQARSGLFTGDLFDLAHTESELLLSSGQLTSLPVFPHAGAEQTSVLIKSYDGGNYAVLTGLQTEPVWVLSMDFHDADSLRFSLMLSEDGVTYSYRLITLRQKDSGIEAAQDLYLTDHPSFKATSGLLPVLSESLTLAPEQGLRNACNAEYLFSAQGMPDLLSSSGQVVHETDRDSLAYTGKMFLKGAEAPYDLSFSITRKPKEKAPAVPDKRLVLNNPQDLQELFLLVQGNMMTRLARVLPYLPAPCIEWLSLLLSAPQ